MSNFSPEIFSNFYSGQQWTECLFCHTYLQHWVLSLLLICIFLISGEVKYSSLFFFELWLLKFVCMCMCEESFKFFICSIYQFLRYWLLGSYLESFLSWLRSIQLCFLWNHILFFHVCLWSIFQLFWGQVWNRVLV